MKHFIITFLLIGLTTALAQSHDHHFKNEKNVEKKKHSDKKYKPTAELKIRMEKILSLMKELNDNKADPKAVVDYGKKITETVNDIFKTCKLEPDADAAIHPSLGLILQGGKEFQNGKYDSGQGKIHQALTNYEKQFAHDGWKH
jgi:hypothetical protein